eukprot:TRINITY_DN10238_c0_g1_i2.p1 TRINITY_DN10238_c0_g1~~TRINITY_DN10238_c0_g1_i2.p1  ORF type:complete len:1040 (-),score=165.99 TRINITY_DN10238_c0_g1_i2:271-3090(-)
MDMHEMYGSPICTVTSSQEGTYRFSKVPCGEYTLISQYPSASSEFEISPDHIKVYVGFNDVNIKEMFQIAGFGISGQVVSTKGVGLENVKIFINGEFITATDFQGMYFLQKMKTGRYDIVAEKENIKFLKLSKVEISPATGTVPILSAQAYSICGKIIVEKKYKLGGRTVTLSEGPQPPKKTTTNNQGEFCFDAVDGKYQVMPIVNKNEGGLNFHPPQREIDVDGAPVLGVIFSQIKMKSSFKIHCKNADCPQDIQLELKSDYRTWKFSVDKPPSDITIKFEKYGIYVEAVDLSPGEYQVSAKKDGWCWGNDKLTFKLSAEDVGSEEIVFDGGSLVQKGFIQEVFIEHVGGEFGVECPKLKSVRWEFTPVSEKEGRSYSECLPTNEECTVKEVTKCFSFIESEEEEIKFQAGRGKTLQLSPKRMRVVSVVQMPEKWSGAAAVVSMYSHSLDKSFEVQTSTSKEAAHDFQNYFSEWFPLDDTLSLTATHSSLVISPRFGHKEVKSAKFKCMDMITFNAMEGVTIKGSIKPELKGANISLTYDEEPEIQSYPEKAQTLSDPKGQFSFGPFLPTVKFEAQVEKIGHVFDEPVCDQEKHTISIVAHKLASIIVHVEMGRGQDMSDILLSLTGPNQYRSNVQTGADGTWTFYGLLSGQYYLRPFFKEWSFNPATLTIDLPDGGEKVVKFVGTRSQYSVYGQVKSITGIGLPDVVAQAENEETGVIETGVTDNSGEFRIKGLTVNNEYSITLKQNKLERHHPNVFRVKMKNKDVKDVNFVAMLYAPNPSLTGIVHIDSQFVNNFKINLTKLDNNKEVEFKKLIEIDYSRWFEIGGLKTGKYVIGLVCDFPKLQFVCDSNYSEVEFDGLKDLYVGELHGGVRARDIEGEGVESGLGTVLGSIVVAGGIMGIIVFVMWDFIQSKQKEVKKETWLPAKAARELSRKMS